MTDAQKTSPECRGWMFGPKRRINFPNGWAIDVHDICDGEVYFQRWPPGVENQGMFDNLVRVPVENFDQLVALADGVYEATTSE